MGEQSRKTTWVDFCCAEALRTDAFHAVAVSRSGYGGAVGNNRHAQ